ncbi:hypothetical protein MVEG_11981 [Podila verticillata NRRL 6337]|uniref:Uncharacterized protein n=1 Tax=Podila verticillata NRRL 6337 TaxID=1069443 RepID=A0A086TKW1_9FUNG|nr:hypothetical protein MVEG_11981 [Podila verticillata NRRL 6337]
MLSSNTTNTPEWGFVINLDAMEQEASSHDFRDQRDSASNSYKTDDNDEDIWFTKDDKDRPVYPVDESSYQRASSSTDKGKSRDTRRGSQDTKTNPTEDVWGVSTAKWPAPRTEGTQKSDDDEALDAITAYWAKDPNTRDLIRSSRGKKPKPPSGTFLRQRHFETDSWGDAPLAIRPYGHDLTDGLMEQKKQEFWSQDEQGQWYLLNNPNPQNTVQRTMTTTTTTTTTTYTTTEHDLEGSVEGPMEEPMEGSMGRRSLEAEHRGYGSEESDERNESGGDYKEDHEDNYDNGWRGYGEPELPVIRKDAPPKKLPRSESYSSFTADGSDMLIPPRYHHHQQQQQQQQQRAYGVEWLPEDQWKTPRNRFITQPPKEDDPWEVANTEEPRIAQPPKEDDPWKVESRTEEKTYEPSVKSPSPSQASEDYQDFHVPLSLDFSTAKPYHDKYDEQSINLPSDAVSRLPAGLLEADDDEDNVGDVDGSAPPSGSPQGYPVKQKDALSSLLDMDMDTEIEITIAPVLATPSRPPLSPSLLLDMSYDDKDEAKPTTPAMLEFVAKEATPGPSRDHYSMAPSTISLLELEQELTPLKISLLDQENMPPTSLDRNSFVSPTISLDQEGTPPTISDLVSLAMVSKISLLDQELSETISKSIPSLLGDLDPSPGKEIFINVDVDKVIDKEPNKAPTDKEPADKEADNKDMASGKVSIDIDPFARALTSPTPFNSSLSSSQPTFEFGVDSWLHRLGAQNKKFHEESLQKNAQQWGSLMAKQQEDSKKLEAFLQRSSVEKKGVLVEVGTETETETTTAKKMGKAIPFSLQVDIETSGYGFQSIHVTEKDDVDMLEKLVDTFCSRYQMREYKMAIYASVASAIKRKKKMIRKDRLEAKLAA